MLHRPPPVTPAPIRKLPTATGKLTNREEEVLAWVAAGKRDGEIAKILQLSPRTVQKHVENILGKLLVENRTTATFWWHERRRPSGQPGSPAES